MKKWIKNLFGKKDDDFEKRQTVEQLINVATHDFDKVTLKGFVYKEAAYQHQQLKIRRSTDANRLKLGEVLRQAFQMDLSTLVAMTVVTRNVRDINEVSTFTLKSAGEIADYDVLRCYINGRPECEISESSYDVTLFIFTTHRNLAINIMYNTGSTENTAYVRLCCLCPDNSEIDDIKTRKSRCRPMATSFLLSYCKTEDDKWFKKYMEIENNVQTKLKQKTKLDEIEFEYACGRQEFRDIYYYSGYGEWLFQKHRYYDAYTQLIRAFNYMKVDFYANDNEIMHIYYKTCMLLGYCCQQMGRHEEAIYFLEQVPSEKLQNLVCPLEDYNKIQHIDDTLSLGYLLNELFGLEKRNIRSGMIIIDNESHDVIGNIDEEAEIWNYPVNNPENSNRSFVLSVTHAYYRMNDKNDLSILEVADSIVITLHPVTIESGEKRVRLDIMLCKDRLNDDKQTVAEQFNIPQYATLILGAQSGKSFGKTVQDCMGCLTYARDMQDQNRALECARLSRWVFTHIYPLTVASEKHGDKPDARLLRILYGACYLLGYSLQELDLPRKAWYYLRMASSSGSMICVSEYINLLANTSDAQAMNMIEHVMKNYAMPEDVEQQKEWKFWMAFLKRRKVYVLINMHHSDEARQMLEEMKEDPLCKDFAERELRYLETFGK